MKKLTIICIISVLIINLTFSKSAKSVAAIVQDPGLLQAVNNLQASGILNTAKILTESLKILTSLENLKEQVRLSEIMLKDIRNGNITPSMLSFTLDIATKCGYKPPKIALKDFPDLNLDKYICSTGNLPMKDIEATFSFKDGLDINQQKVVLKNIEKLKDDNYVYGLSLGLNTRVIDLQKDMNKITKQMENPSLANQLYVNNQIQLMIVSQLVEMRRLLGVLVETTCLDNNNSFKTIKSN